MSFRQFHRTLADERQQDVAHERRVRQRLLQGETAGWYPDLTQQFEAASTPRPSSRPMQTLNAPEHVTALDALAEKAQFQTITCENGLEQVVAASPVFNPKNDFFIKRVTAGVGWAVHGVVFEYWNGKRQGSLLIDFGDRQNMTLTDKNLEKRNCVGWTDIEYGDYIVGMHGNYLKNRRLLWFCHSMTLEFASGKSITYASNHQEWKGKPFSYSVPKNCLVFRIAFKNDQAEDMLGLVTSLHLPLSRTNIAYLPPEHKNVANAVLLIAKRVDYSRVSNGEKPLGEDVWWHILGFIRAWELSPTTRNNSAVLE